MALKLKIQQGTGEQKQVAFLGTVSELAQKRQHLNKNQNKNKNRRQQNQTTPNSPAQNTNAPHNQPLLNAAPTMPGHTHASSNNNTAQSDANNGGSSNNKQPKRPCHICGEMHWTSQRPHLALCQSVVASNNSHTDAFTGITSTTHLAPTDIILDDASEPYMWTTVETERDPLQLWTAIKATHTTYSSGLKEVDECRARTANSALRQSKTETITAFKDRMEVYVRFKESLGMTVPSQGQLATDFLDKLNDMYDYKRNVLYNNAKLGGSYPKTFFEACKIMTELYNESHTINVASSSVVNVTKQNQNQNQHQNQHQNQN